MVSFWPWKGEDNSPASFEKSLSALSTKITETTTRLDNNRQTARRVKAIWTLYAIFAYTLYTIAVALLVGWENYGLKEIPALVGGPVIIYAVRAGTGKCFDYWIARTQRHLEALQKERAETIEKLKIATKYNSTQQLLEKYGGETSKPTRSKSEKQKSDSKRKPSQQQQQPVARTGISPPPTANIPRASPNQPPSTPQNFSPYQPSPYGAQPQPQLSPQPPSPFPPQSPPDAPGFAPNAFPSAPQYIEQSHWYDRLLDVLLGEDETQPKNRIALICKNCRLVNGQAPPGIKTLEGLGKWRCGGCGSMNGEESETTKVLADLRSRSAEEARKPEEGDNLSSGGEVTDEGVIVGRSEEETVESDEEETEERPVEASGQEAEPEPEPETETNRRSTRSRSKANKKKG